MFWFWLFIIVVLGRWSCSKLPMDLGKNTNFPRWQESSTQLVKWLNFWICTFIAWPIGSMYGIFITDIYHKNQLNVGEYTVDGIGERTSLGLLWLKFAKCSLGERCWSKQLQLVCFYIWKKFTAQLHTARFLGLVLTSNHLCWTCWRLNRQKEFSFNNSM